MRLFGEVPVDTNLKLWFKTRFSEFKLCGFYLCNDEKGAGKKNSCFKSAKYRFEPSLRTVSVCVLYGNRERKPQSAIKPTAAAVVAARLARSRGYRHVWFSHSYCF